MTNNLHRIVPDWWDLGLKAGLLQVHSSLHFDANSHNQSQHLNVSKSLHLNI